MTVLSELVDDVYAVLKDELRQYVKENEVITWLNEAQRDLASRTHELVTDEKTGTVGEDVGTYFASDGLTDLATNRILLPTDFIMCRKLQMSGSFEPVRFVDDEIYDSYALRGATPVATLGRIFAMQTYDVTPVVTGQRRFVEMYPAQDGYDYTMRYTRSPRDLYDPGDVVEVPAYLENKMVYYARAWGWDKRGERGLYESHMAMYRENLPAPPRGQATTRPGPMTLVPEGNAFDHDPDAQHLG